MGYFETLKTVNFFGEDNFQLIKFKSPGSPDSEASSFGCWNKIREDIPVFSGVVSSESGVNNSNSSFSYGENSPDDYVSSYYDEGYMDINDPQIAFKLKNLWQDVADKQGLDQNFFNKIVEISKNVGCHPEDLLAVLNGESGLNPRAENSNGGATGLNQMMPATLEKYGLTPEEYKNMSATEQLDYVEKFLINAKNISSLRNSSTLSGEQLYAINFLPAFADRFVLTNSTGTAGAGDKAIYYSHNSGSDYNKDGDIDLADLQIRIRRKRRLQAVA